LNTIGIIGGGAAGFFSAIRAAELNPKNKIIIFEQGGQLLKKVRISGGGRCNVTHHQYEINKFCDNYPRGKKELKSPFHSFQAQDTVHWFKEKGVRLVAEADGRMFPDTNSSETIISCFINLTKKYNIEVLKNHKIQSIKNENGVFNLVTSQQVNFKCDKVLLCTGSSSHGYQLVQSLGHNITERAPSLFSFKVKHPLFKDLSGISFPDSQLKLITSAKANFKQAGPLLITHQGLSGPAVLKLSAWAAREMKICDYKAKLLIKWIPNDISELISQLKTERAKSNIINAYPEDIPKRFWHNLLSIYKISADLKWADINKKQINLILSAINNFECNINGQNRFKDEFVECGGVNLKEINFKTMESKTVPGLHFAGELLDVDGVTGGFNFQNAWTTAWLAASNMSN